MTRKFIIELPDGPAPRAVPTPHQILVALARQIAGEDIRGHCTGENPETGAVWHHRLAMSVTPWQEEP